MFINKVMAFKIYRHSIVTVTMNKHCVQLKWEIWKEVVFDAEEQKHQKRIDLKSFKIVFVFPSRFLFVCNYNVHAVGHGIDEKGCEKCLLHLFPSSTKNLIFCRDCAWNTVSKDNKTLKNIAPLTTKKIYCQCHLK